MGIGAENRALKDKERNFVHLMVYDGLPRDEAYAHAYGQDMCRRNKESIRVQAAKVFYKANVNSYYLGLLDEVKEKEMNKAVWTREVAAKKLMKLIERAETDIYGDAEKGLDEKTITPARLNAVMLPIKELNLMNGFNQTNTNVEGLLVQIVGEADLPE